MVSVRLIPPVFKQRRTHQHKQCVFQPLSTVVWCIVILLYELVLLYAPATGLDAPRHN